MVQPTRPHILLDLPVPELGVVLQKPGSELRQLQQSTIARLEDADYEGHSLSILRRIAEALNQKLEVRFVPNRAA